MANYYANFRSNYFEVKDVEKFSNWCKLWDVVFFRREQDGKTFVGFYNESHEGGVPAERYDHNRGEFIEDTDFLAEIADHLMPGSVAIVQEVGNEKLRYLTGYSVAIDSTGETLTVNISDIYHLVKREWGKEPTRAEY